MENLRELSAQDLAAAWERWQAARSAAQERCDLVHAELERRYRRKAEKLLAGKTHGTVHVIDGGLDVAVEFPGTDMIDQAKMARAIARLEAGGTAWREFVRVDYVVRRTVLKALPDKLRKVLEAPISVEVGKLRFAIRPARAAQVKKAA